MRYEHRDWRWSSWWPILVGWWLWEGCDNFNRHRTWRKA